MIWVICFLVWYVIGVVLCFSCDYKYKKNQGNSGFSIKDILIEFAFGIFGLGCLVFFEEEIKEFFNKPIIRIK